MKTKAPQVAVDPDEEEPAPDPPVAALKIVVEPLAEQPVEPVMPLERLPEQPVRAEQKPVAFVLLFHLPFYFCLIIFFLM